MADEKKSTKMPHSIIMENRKLLTATGVSDVDSFDEQSVTAYTDLGELSIRGNGLHISKLNVETGTYSENRSSSGGLLSKLFR